VPPRPETLVHRTTGHSVPERARASYRLKSQKSPLFIPASKRARYAHSRTMKLGAIFSIFALGLVVGATASQSPCSLKGRKALVTGGSKGIGRGIVEELLAHGCTVVTCARDTSPLDDLCKSHEGQLHVLCADVSTSEGRKCLVSFVDDSLDGNLDILVNNVGTNVRKASEDFRDDEYDQMMRTNIDSAFHFRGSAISSSRLLGTEALLICLRFLD